MKRMGVAVASMALAAGMVFSGAGAAQAVDWFESPSYSTGAQCNAERRQYVQNGFRVMACVQPPRTNGAVRWTFFWAR